MVRDSEEECEEEEILLFCFAFATTSLAFTRCTSADMVKAPDNVERNTENENPERFRQSYHHLNRESFNEILTMVYPL